MNDLTVLVPSRGRPDNVRRLSDAYRDTKASWDTELHFGFDDDDETEPWGVPNITHEIGPRLRLCGTLNQMATNRVDSCRYIGFLGDDHRPRTAGWDQKVIDALEGLGTGIVYGNDLFQGPNLPTAVFMTTDIVRALGYMAPPALTHLFLDNSWKAWGEGIGRLVYLPDCVIEHMHPEADGKAVWDDRYEEVNSPEMWEKDQAAWGEYCANDLAGDLEKLRALL